MNTAIIPTPACEHDFYDWYERHEAVKAYIAKEPIELVFIGDSLTHLFGGKPTPNLERGNAVWEEYYGRRHAANLGFGWDRIQQALWRVEHGEMAGIQPKVAVLLIGTNNLHAGNAPVNTPTEVVEGISALIHAVRRQAPGIAILLLGLFPRGEQPNDPLRWTVAEINSGLAVLDGRDNVTFLDIGAAFVNPDGTISPEIMSDFLHLTEEGYRIWAARMEPTLARLLGA